jgi:glutaredoxin
MSTIIYGIKNCDTMKKARARLDGHGVAYSFHDYKTEGISKEQLERWEALFHVQPETFLNEPVVNSFAIHRVSLERVTPDDQARPRGAFGVGSTYGCPGIAESDNTGSSIGRLHFKEIVEAILISIVLKAVPNREATDL